MQANFQTITPAIAQQMLAANTSNRILRKHHVVDLARDMCRGRYQVNGDSIRFDVNGVLLDGQHRLSAIVESETDQHMLVITGLAPETMRTIDSGIKRNNGDRLSLEGAKNGNAIAAALNIMGCIANNASRMRYTSSEILEFYRKHPGIQDSIRKSYGSSVLTVSYLTAFHYMGTYTGYAKEADAFVETMKCGIPSRADDPAIAARERLIRIRSSGAEVQRPLTMEILCVAWEAIRTNRPLNVIRHKTKGDKLTVHGWGRLDISEGKLDH